MSFVDETNCKTDHKSCSSWVGGEESFFSRLPKTALNSGFLPFDPTEKTSSNLHLVLEGFFEKNCVNELCEKSTEKIIWHSHTRKKGSSLLL